MPKTMTVIELRRALAAQERRLEKLVARRTQLAAKLAAVDSAIKALGGTAATAPKAAAAPRKRRAGGRRTKAGSKDVKPLVEWIKDVLAKAPDGMRVMEIEAAVKQAGYPTRSKYFYTQVTAALRDGPFQKVSRGVHRLAPGS